MLFLDKLKVCFSKNNLKFSQVILAMTILLVTAICFLNFIDSRDLLLRYLIVIMAILALIESFCEIDFKSVIIAIGVFGTFIGVTNSMPDDGASFSFIQLLGGMKLALQSSIFAIGISILLEIFERLFEHKSACPIYYEIQKLNKGINEKITEKLSTHIVDKFIKTIQYKLYKELTDTTQKFFIDLSDKNKQLYKRILKAISMSSKQIGDTNVEIKDKVGEFSSSITSAEDIMKNNIQKLSKTISSVDNNLQKSKEYAESIEKTQQTVETIDKLKETLEDYNQSLDEINKKIDDNITKRDKDLQNGLENVFNLILSKIDQKFGETRKKKDSEA